MKSILKMDNLEAKSKLLEESSYCTTILPKYIKFQEILNYSIKNLGGRNLDDFSATDNDGKRICPSHLEKVNYTFYVNKHNTFSWRPITLIHPLLYIDLVNYITEENNWEYITSRFKEFQNNNKINCVSIPSFSLSKFNDKETMINKWWSKFTQKQYKVSMIYSHVIHTDIADCYGSIYSHSIPWALHTKDVAKTKRNNKNLVGNGIDTRLQRMQYGQTNGIPQGSVLMDFIAEIVLGYVDKELGKLIELDDYFILRYRDDYRIFTNNATDGHNILKLLSEILQDIGLQLNDSKTNSYTDIISSIEKKDKEYWRTQEGTIDSLIRDYDSKKNNYFNHQKHMLEIYKLSLLFPNSGSLIKALKQYKNRIKENTKKGELETIIPIIVEIMKNNPRALAPCTLIISLYLKSANKEMIEKYIDLIIDKFDNIPNTEYLEIWLQRLVLHTNKEKEFSSLICQKVVSIETEIWDSSWTNFDFNENIIIDNQMKESIGTEVTEEVFLYEMHSI